jgi:tetratricopeptide (TPR) repeat protein
VPLALLLLGCAGVVAFAAWQSARESIALAGISASLLAYAVAVSVNFTTPGTTVVASLAVGLVAARAAGSVPRPGARLVPVLAAGLCGAVLMFAVAGEVLVGQADSAMAAGDVAGASGAWDSAAALRPSDVDVALRHGRSFTSAVDAGLAAKPECLSSTEAAWAALPRSSEAATDRAHCLELNARYGDAEAVLAAATDHDPVNVDLWLLRGVVAAEGGDTAAAIGHLTRATELRPTASEAWTDLAVVHRMRGETAAAAAAETRARQLASAEGR